MIGCINEVLLQNEEFTPGVKNMDMQNAVLQDKRSPSKCHIKSVVRASLK